MGQAPPVAVAAPRKGLLPRLIIRMIGLRAVPLNWRVIITLTLRDDMKSHLSFGFLANSVARP